MLIYIIDCLIVFFILQQLDPSWKNENLYIINNWIFNELNKFNEFLINSFVTCANTTRLLAISCIPLLATFSSRFQSVASFKLPVVMTWLIDACNTKWNEFTAWYYSLLLLINHPFRNTKALKTNFISWFHYDNTFWFLNCGKYHA